MAGLLPPDYSRMAMMTLGAILPPLFTRSAVYHLVIIHNAEP